MHVYGYEHALQVSLQATYFLDHIPSCVSYGELDDKRILSMLLCLQMVAVGRRGLSHRRANGGFFKAPVFSKTVKLDLRD